jgi:hypothetical protein
VTPAPSPQAPPTPTKPEISKAALKYFYKIALGAEYMNDEKVVTKWNRAIVTVHAEGSVSAASRKCLNKVIADFNALTATTDLELTSARTADVKVHFAPVSRFPSIEPNYVPGNYGFFYVRWQGHAITDAVVLISTTGITNTARCHLIREELTQSTGLMRDSNDYPTSVFYGPWTTSTRYSSMDKQLIRLLYSGALRPGDNQREVAEAVTAV